MKLFLTTKIWREGKHYIAYTPELDVASQGGNPDRALERLREAVEIFLEETKRRGTLNEVLGQAGFLKKNRRWETPQISISSFDVAV
ncbi:hypothetical protein A2935_03885 [Candidatus Wolfebacteria bacterium RIFCSPLOWO2_01_FULL_47_17b]|uniref:HicB-like antitoxin of toxin-antitoxin system domain-containing protein n=1 Tax=Candidatus Wolfebacteria bacterium RIFCSPLOWO2_01_FULL_47_17b TaxID=1802558 RepID=A0A1F8DWU6_9BACT|nr:MAG: hypothetical protein A2935_03885 [Candidatus Wolfebacteria bacterium RIFCSPLOWO2_01_FULL_47_17b]